MFAGFKNSSVLPRTLPLLFTLDRALDYLLPFRPSCRGGLVTLSAFGARQSRTGSE